MTSAPATALGETPQKNWELFVVAPRTFLGKRFPQQNAAAAAGA